MHLLDTGRPRAENTIDIGAHASLEGACSGVTEDTVGCDTQSDLQCANEHISSKGAVTVPPARQRAVLRHIGLPLVPYLAFWPK